MNSGHSGGNDAQCKWQRPDLPSKCTYKLGTPLSKSPHRHVTRFAVLFLFQE